jgi:hypothetical protein
LDEEGVPSDLIASQIREAAMLFDNTKYGLDLFYKESRKAGTDRC